MLRAALGEFRNDPRTFWFRLFRDSLSPTILKSSENPGSTMMRIAVLTTLVFAFLAMPAFADPATECEGSSQVEIGTCVAETLRKADASLEVFLGFAAASAEELDAVTGREVAAPALEASQAAWQAYRDAHCEYVGASFGGGSGTGIGIDSCKIELAREREKELRRYFQ